ncbi:MAG: SGNH/GDSL hydrolase family protein [Planctomycetes bacterium]|nr:SGNH/GDSL hydrolase family protein [Planctomycetota bacterium]
MARKIEKFTFGILTIAALLAACEGIVRALWQPAPPRKPPLEFINADFGSGFPIERDDLLFWKLKPGGEIPVTGEKINVDGTRMLIGPKSRPAYTGDSLSFKTHAYSLGDSNTFGIGVPSDATYTSRIDRWNHDTETGLLTELDNFGTPGYSIYQIHELLKTLDLGTSSQFQSEFVLLYAGAWNDYMPAIGADDETLGRRVENWNRIRNLSGIHKLAMFRFIENAIAPSSTSAGEGAASRSHDDVARAFFTKGERPNGPRVSTTSFRNILNSIVDLTLQHNAKIVLITPALPAATRAKSKYGEEYVKIIEEVAAARESTGSVALARAREALAKPEAEDKIYFFDGVHPSARGHEVIAGEIAKALVKLKIAPDAPFVSEDPAHPEAMPILLKKHMAAAKLIVDGVPGTSAAAADAEDPYQIVLPPSSTLVFDNIVIPRAASLILERSVRPSADPTLTKKCAAKWRVRVMWHDMASDVFQSSDVYEGSRWTAPIRDRVDLSHFAGTTVQIWLTVESDAFRASFGAGEIHPFQ